MPIYHPRNLKKEKKRKRKIKSKKINKSKRKYKELSILWQYNYYKYTMVDEITEIRI